MRAIRITDLAEKGKEEDTISPEVVAALDAIASLEGQYQELKEENASLKAEIKQLKGSN
ncbi:hypothetical protein [Brevibacillus laterosporus]|uniref:Uncharacterized protein n=1 Tax=Brevibacillus laterosporus TaxID=1465 RepID=A0AAP3DGR1_BRELA|nr:hypothetical protein [Brevibacillus laterosporus]MCR8980723.1 hypothetical protein [Brevibacillus laterosporus]MCZ0807878.1 hypothetical protein [Brevibacillus laterosporus]MCZ0826231.1 hypothetical protein [Brevibacillus laterosporus]MCZ0851242.1 hypothetical protein [Brevibacillus laterosporus]